MDFYLPIQAIIAATNTRTRPIHPANQESADNQLPLLNATKITAKVVNHAIALLIFTSFSTYLLIL